jgi:hypothetical protein
MRWFGHRRRAATSDEVAPPEEIELSSDRMVLWKSKEQVDGEDYGPVWIVDANDPNVTLEEPDEWLSWDEAQQFARARGMRLEDV